MRVALLLVASAHAFVRPTLHALRSPTQRPALSPEMAGAIAKAKDAAGYEAIVQETMVKEDCTYEEAVERYNQYLFDPDGYSIIKMNEQIRDAGFNSYEEYFIAEKGQEAWDQRQADLVGHPALRAAERVFHRRGARILEHRVVQRVEPIVELARLYQVVVGAGLLELGAQRGRDAGGHRNAARSTCRVEGQRQFVVAR